MQMIGTRAKPAAPNPQRYPMLLSHPDHVAEIEPAYRWGHDANGRKLSCKLDDGTPAVNPNLAPRLVENETEEAAALALGYVAAGTFDRAAAAAPNPMIPVTGAEWPKWLPTGGKDASGTPNGVVVKSATEEAAARAKYNLPPAGAAVAAQRDASDKMSVAAPAPVVAPAAQPPAPRARRRRAPIVGAIGA